MMRGDKEMAKSDYGHILRELKSMTNATNVAGMARFGITPKNKVLGISIYVLRKMAKTIGTDHKLALRLWASEIHEARLLASLVDDPEDVTGSQMEEWVSDFDSWDICDQCCSNLFDKTNFAWKKAVEWAGRQEEFVKRAGYVMMAALSVHDERASDKEFIAFMPLIVAGSTDERNFVKKAVNWALRQIGKRNIDLNLVALKTADKIGRIPSKSARWVSADAMRELKSEKVQARLRARSLVHK